MQGELDAESHMLPIRILGVNAVGHESGNAAVCNGRTIPWLQDTPQAMVWSAWAVTYRDVIVLDTENKPIAVYNLTINNLGDPVKYAELKAILANASDGL